MGSLFGSLSWHCGHIARRLRTDRQHTQADLARLAGVPLSALQRLEESGDSSLSVLTAVTGTLGTSPSALLEYVQIMNARMATRDGSPLDSSN